jgi:hypothetical protein
MTTVQQQSSHSLNQPTHSLNQQTHPLAYDISARAAQKAPLLWSRSIFAQREHNIFDYCVCSFRYGPSRKYYSPQVMGVSISVYATSLSYVNFTIGYILLYYTIFYYFTTVNYHHNVNNSPKQRVILDNNISRITSSA